MYTYSKSQESFQVPETEIPCLTGLLILGSRDPHTEANRVFDIVGEDFSIGSVPDPIGTQSPSENGNGT